METTSQELTIEKLMKAKALLDADKAPTQSTDIPLSVIEQIYANNEAFSKEFADAWNAYVDKMLKEEELKCQH
jgi:hypothetical protein